MCYITQAFHQIIWKLLIVAFVIFFGKVFDMFVHSYHDSEKWFLSMWCRTMLNEYMKYLWGQYKTVCGIKKKCWLCQAFTIKTDRNCWVISKSSVFWTDLFYNIIRNNVLFTKSALLLISCSFIHSHWFSLIRFHLFVFCFPSLFRFIRGFVVVF